MNNLTREDTAVPAARRQRRPPAPRAAPAAPTREARQRACVILEVLAGGRTPLQAAQALAVSLSRYYLLEDKALQGLLAACEAAPRGRTADEGRLLEAARCECQRWQRECARQQALVRAAQRTIGLAAPAPPPRGQGRPQEAQAAPAGGAGSARGSAAAAGGGKRAAHLAANPRV